ncbi:hypothetical protein SG34_009365 [Thalassomonas viridans]|uniref:Uncharacterized protein n=1 Tax=Thalassomonas viridans TaxID=137584 RepID=A0AAE9Z6B4_9GAMM|nr:hypothetical protein [Thalassomonas viridans]WDE07072.1 hypothetical protein SG34_009365 [Thalassomonas viridans]
MLYKLIARLDKTFNFATVSAYGEAGDRNELAAGQMQVSACSPRQDDLLNLAENACDGGLL